MLARVSSLEGGSSATASQVYTFSNQPITRLGKRMLPLQSGSYSAILLIGQNITVAISPPSG